MFKLKKKAYTTVHPIDKSGRFRRYMCWVNELGGYFAYCHKDGRLITRTGKGLTVNQDRTWSSVGEAVVQRTLCVVAIDEKLKES